MSAAPSAKPTETITPTTAKSSPVASMNTRTSDGYAGMNAHALSPTCPSSVIGSSEG